MHPVIQQNIQKSPLTFYVNGCIMGHRKFHEERTNASTGKTRERKTMKKTIAIALSGLLMFSGLGASVYAEEEPADTDTIKLKNGLNEIKIVVKAENVLIVQEDICYSIKLMLTWQKLE